MSTTLIPQLSPPPDGPGEGPPRPRVAKRVWLAALAVAVVGAALWGLVLLSWMVDEKHFDRPSEQLDAFAAELEGLPGVDEVATERWVEAPTFSDPTSVMSVTVQRSGLPGVLEAACSTGYPDPITWSIIVRTPSAAEVTLQAGASAGAAGGEQCPEFGFDAVGIVDELDRVAPGLAIAPSAWRDGMLSLVALEEGAPAGVARLLPLVEHAEDLRTAAGFPAGADLEINSANLGLILEPGKESAYLRLLTELVGDRGVTSFWADGGEPTDGVEKVQVVAPDSQHAAIEESIRASELRIAGFPVRFIEQ